MGKKKQPGKPKDEKTDRPRRVMIVDDHPIVRHGLCQLIRQEPDLEVCAEEGSAPDALALLAEARPDIILLDISIEGANGIEMMKAICEQGVDTPVLMLSMHDENLYAERSLRAGAKGYVTKQENPDVLLRAIRRVLQGKLYVSEAIASRMLLEMVQGADRGEKKMGIDRLSDRELEVFELVGRGLSTRTIAEKMGLSVKTVETHRAHIKRKLQIASSVELTQQAVRWHEGDISQ